MRRRLRCRTRSQGPPRAWCKVRCAALPDEGHHHDPDKAPPSLNCSGMERQGRPVKALSTTTGPSRLCRTNANWARCNVIGLTKLQDFYLAKTHPEETRSRAYTPRSLNSSAAFTCCRLVPSQPCSEISNTTPSGFRDLRLEVPSFSRRRGRRITCRPPLRSRPRVSARSST